MLRHSLVWATRLTLTGLNQDEDVVHAHSQYQERDHLHDNKCGSHTAETKYTDGAHHRCENDQHSWGNIVILVCKIDLDCLNNFIQNEKIFKKKYLFMLFFVKMSDIGWWPIPIQVNKVFLFLLKNTLFVLIFINLKVFFSVLFYSLNKKETSNIYFTLF